MEVREVQCPGQQHPVLGFIPKGAGLDGYGKKISTRWQVRYTYNGPWYAVFCTIFSNNGSLWTSKGSAGVELAIHRYSMDKKE
jgi:hypothetical protein